MAATRLSDSQKKELVERFRAGEGSQLLADAYGCSTATVIRTVRAALSPEEYEGLKQQGGRRASAPPSAAAPAAGTDPDPDPDHLADPPESPADIDEEVVADTVEEDSDEVPGVLAIDDADDFGNDDDDDLFDEAGDEAEGDGEADGDGDEAAMFVPIAPIAAVDDRGVVEVIPLSAAQLPPSAYMLVDKTVELQAQPLSDFPELGRLAPEELQRQALVVFANPRQARRQCGRSQRVIKLPDTTLLERTSRYLLAQGISRVLMEGALYSLPGS